jgi:hypothetical protein
VLVRGALSDVVTVSRAGHMVAGDQTDAFSSVVTGGPRCQ